MKRVLVTGAGGFVGANLVARLLKDGHRVHAITQPESNLWRLDEFQKQCSADLAIHPIGLTNQSELSNLAKSVRPDWIFHLAASGAYSWQTDWRSIIETNIVGLMNLTHACLEVGFQSFVSTGSSSEYGLKDHAPSEDEAVEPNSYYAVAKSSATHFCQYLARTHKMRMHTLRLYSVYGPFEDSRRFIPTLIKHALQGTLPPLVEPTVARDYVFTEDVVDALLLAADKDDQAIDAVYNIGTGVQTSIAEAVEAAREIFGITEEPKWGSMENRGWDTSIWVSDNRRAVEHLGWKPRVDLKTGLQLTADWLCSSPAAESYYGVKTPCRTSGRTK